MAVDRSDKLTEKAALSFILLVGSQPKNRRTIEKMPVKQKQADTDQAARLSWDLAIITCARTAKSKNH